MTILITALLSTQIITLLLGVLVYLTNSKRLVNKQFLVLSIHLTMWAFCVLRIIESTDSSEANFWIRAAFVVTAFFPGSFTLLLSAIKQGTSSWLTLYVKLSPFLLLNLVAALLPFTPFFIHEVVFTEQEVEGGSAVPEAIYGAGYYIYVVYFIATCIVAGHTFYRTFRKSYGIQHYEMQFILCGFGASFCIGVLSSLLLPILLGNNQMSQFGPLGIILLDAIVAYGITTRNILGIATILQKVTAHALLTLYLILVYYCVWAVTPFLFSSLVGTYPMLSHLLATVAIAISMLPARGRFQQAANKLISSNTMDVTATMKRANSVFQSITTMEPLLDHFAGLLSRALSVNDIMILTEHRGFFSQSYPKISQEQGSSLQPQSPLIQLVIKTNSPITKDFLSRTRQTKLNKAAEYQLTNLESSIAVGIFSKQRISGLVLLGSRIGGKIYDKVEQDALQILCNQFAVALENAQLYTEMQDSKIQNEIMLDRLVSGVVVANPDRKVTLINHEAQRITGLTKEQTIGQNIDLLPKTITSALDTTLSAQKGVQNIATILFPREEEKRIHVRMGSAYLLGHDDNPMGALLVFTDMTEMKSLEEQVRRADQLSSVGTLAAGMAHEIKNPLVTIQTFTQLLPERHEDADFRTEFSSLVAHEVSRIDSIVNQLLTFSKPSQPHLVPLKLHNTLENTLKLMHEQAALKNIVLENQLKAKQDLISGDADLLTQILVNFNLNAIEAIGRDGTITVGTTNCTYRFSRNGSAVKKFCIRLQISDTGQGIAEDQLKKIFDPFYTSKSEGTGMGLSVALGIIQEHHGEIEVDSRQGKGTTFRVYIPLLEEDAPA